MTKSWDNGERTLMDYSRIVEDIQAAVASPATMDWDLLGDTAAEYGFACDEVNKRLKECGELVSRGLRSEAILLAEREPKLLDAVSSLDFLERESWLSLLAAHGKVCPPPLRIDIAADLNAAYFALAPLQRLLKQHRLLALARAPISSRIQTLRQMLAADPETSAWRDDLKSLEQVRLSEIAQELEGAVRQRNSTLLDKLATELQPGNWIAKPSRDLVERCRRHRSSLAAEAAMEVLVAAEGRLNRAFATLDVPSGRAAREQWLQALPVASLPDDHPLLVSACPALKWLAQEDANDEQQSAFESAVFALDRGLDDELPREKLERLYATALRCEMDLPQITVARYAERIRVFETQGRRRFRLAVLATVGGLVIMSLAGFGVMKHFAYERRAATAANKLEQMLADDRVQEALEVVNNLQGIEPLLMEHPAIQSQVAQVRQRVTSESERQESFSKLLEELEATPWEQVSSQGTDRARALAQRSDEHDRLAALEMRLASARRAKQEERDQRFRSDIERAVADVARHEKSMVADAGREQDATDIRLRLDSLAQRSPSVSREIAAQLAPIRARFESVLKQQAASAQLEAAISKVESKIGDVNRYSESLEEFVRLFPNHPLSTEFSRSLKDRALWQAQQDLNACLIGAKFKNLKSLSPAESQAFLTRITPWLEMLPTSPQSMEIARRRPHFEAIAARGATVEDKPRLQYLKSLFDDSIMTRLWMVVDTEDHRYYTLQDVSEPFDQNVALVNIQYLTDWTFNERKISLRPSSVKANSRAPQYAITQAVREPLRSMERGQWDKGAIEILRILIDAKETEPLLRLRVLRSAMEQVLVGSRGLQIALEPIKQRMSEDEIDVDANWLNPAIMEARFASRQASDLLAELSPHIAFTSPEAMKATEQARQQVAADLASFDLRLTWVGWVRPRDGRLVVGRRAGAAAASADLWTFYQNDAGLVVWSPVRISTAEDLVESPSDPSAIVAGRPIFLREIVDGGAEPSGSSTP